MSNGEPTPDTSSSSLLSIEYLVGFFMLFWGCLGCTKNSDLDVGMFTRRSSSSQKLEDLDGYNGLFNKRGMVEHLMVGVERSIHDFSN